MHHKRSNTAGSFSEHLKLPGKRMSFSHGIWRSSGKLKQKKNQVLNAFKIRCRECSTKAAIPLFLSQST